VQQGYTFNFFNCSKTKVVIEGKIKNFMLSKCIKFDLQVDDAMSMGEIIKCENVKLYIQQGLP